MLIMHIPAEEAELMKEEMFVYRRGILTEANGNVEVKLMTKVSEIVTFHILVLMLFNYTTLYSLYYYGVCDGTQTLCCTPYIKQPTATLLS